jgi:hypothetical protein
LLQYLERSAGVAQEEWGRKEACLCRGEQGVTEKTKGFVPEGLRQVFFLLVNS